jgi:ribulose kinase
MEQAIDLLTDEVDADMDLTKNPVVASTLIDCFLSGITNGRAVLEAMYGDAGDEPIPSRLLDLVRGATCAAS